MKRSTLARIVEGWADTFGLRPADLRGGSTHVTAAADERPRILVLRLPDVTVVRCPPEHLLVVLGRAPHDGHLGETQDEDPGPVVGGRGDVGRTAAQVGRREAERVRPALDDAGERRALHASAGVTRTGSSVTSSPSMRKLRNEGASSCCRLTMA